MAIRVFRERELTQALTRVYVELGPEATVLEQRQVRQSRWWPFSRRYWEVIATLQDGDAPAREEEEQATHLEAEIAELRSNLARLVRSAHLSQLPHATRVVTECYDTLCAQGMPGDLAGAVVLAAQEELSGAAQNKADLVHGAVRRQLEREVHIRPPKLTPGKGPLVIFILGQAGVGKTTTLIKLAARQVLFEGRSVAVINADTVRPASQPQLESLAQILDVPVEPLSDLHPEELQVALASYADRDVVFVDTPGYGRRDRAPLQGLKALTKAAPRRQSFLVISGSTALEEMNQILRSFRGIGLDGLILSKLDETDLLGAAVTIACQSSVPVAYLTAGRRIPEDIDTATPERISGLLFGADLLGSESASAMLAPTASKRQSAGASAADGNGTRPRRKKG